ncbi:unnamed protein product [Oppiella nova]|uniref:50S ribosomal protein L13, chloroplastic n=3 Tax=cellular organisms TaxID=131567 RepID=A0A7R9Q8E4_9ACAR|nr:unnamed protein product [Oppiella nova]CAG2155873.1 unnamed protein product [Oppiella nova]
MLIKDYSNPLVRFNFSIDCIFATSAFIVIILPLHDSIDFFTDRDVLLIHFASKIYVLWIHLIELGLLIQQIRLSKTQSKPTIIGSGLMKTLSAKPAEVQHDWYVVDASGKTLGRLATEIARRLRGKHKTSYTPHVDTGDYIVVINAEQVQVTVAHKPEEIFERAVKGMLPKGPLGYAMIKKMKVYAGTEHPHTAQQPQVLDI